MQFLFILLAIESVDAQQSGVVGVLAREHWDGMMAEPLLSRDTRRGKIKRRHPKMRVALNPSVLDQQRNLDAVMRALLLDPFRVSAAVTEVHHSLQSLLAASINLA